MRGAVGLDVRSDHRHVADPGILADLDTVFDFYRRKSWLQVGKDGL